MQMQAQYMQAAAVPAHSVSEHTPSSELHYWNEGIGGNSRPSPRLDAQNWKQTRKHSCKFQKYHASVD